MTAAADAAMRTGRQDSEMNIKKAKGLKALVVGLGISGKAAVAMLNSEGARTDMYDARETAAARKLADEGEYSHISFGDRPSNVKGYDLVVLSPGISPQKDYVKEAEADGAEIIGELELAYRYGKGKYVAITGTNGKTTTTTLIYDIYKAAGLKAELAGNIGVAVAPKSMYCDEDTYLITECSSFQLETTKEFKPHISVILNVTPDHLDRHGSFENYAKAKAKVFANQTKDDFCIYNNNDEVCRKLMEDCPATAIPFSDTEELERGAFVKDGNIVIRDGSADQVVCGADELLILGRHNLQNALAAAAAAHFGGIPADVTAEVLRTFKGIKHRMQDCGTIDGVKYVNDSKGTNPDAAVKAITSYKNIVLIAGGYDKKGSFDEFVKSFEGRVKALVLMGVTAPAIREAAEKTGFTNIYDVNNMREAVKKSAELAQPGDTVLLSPACASWDMYKNFELRGDDFIRNVEELRSGK